MKDNSLGIIIILGVIAIALFGGSKGAGNNGLLTSGRGTPTQKQQNVEGRTKTTESGVDYLKDQLKTEEDVKNRSEYYGVVTLKHITKSKDPSSEYVTIRASQTEKIISVTGWKLKSLSTGNSVNIPKATYLFFTGMQNVEEDIYLTSGDTLYLITGLSPNGVSFKSNKCSGYLGQFQKFTPYISNKCPLPENEDLSSIPKTRASDTCFDYIDSMSQCKIPTKSLPTNLSSECTKFIYEKVNYASCINVHKNDKDFYQNEWRVYLKRSETLWGNKREAIVLYDGTGKVVSTLKY